MTDVQWKNAQEELISELDMMLQVLEKIRKLNSEGKTLQIDNEITPILKHYNKLP